MNRDLNRKSKFLSLILRHKPEVINATMDKNGWVRCQEIRNNTYNTRNQLTQADLVSIVESDDKNRYSFKDHNKMIRANQGHSLDIDLDLESSQPPRVLYHGTKYHTFNKHISKDGLKPMDRMYVHLSEDMTTALTVGDRRVGNTILLHVDTERMFNDGVEFYKSVNGVWLTREVEPKYIKQLVS